MTEHRPGEQPGEQKGRGVRTVPQMLWAPLAAGALLLLVGVLGLAAGQPLLFPSLGPTAFLQVETPDQPGARFRNVVVGHGVGIAAGLAAVLVLHAASAPGLFAAHELVPVRMWASIIAIMLTLLGGLLLHASHPPAAATTLLISLGGFRPTVHDVVVIVVGVLVIAVAGEGLRRLRVNPAPR